MAPNCRGGPIPKKGNVMLKHAKPLVCPPAEASRPSDLGSISGTFEIAYESMRLRHERRLAIAFEAVKTIQNWRPCRARHH